MCSADFCLLPVPLLYQRFILVFFSVQFNSQDRLFPAAVFLFIYYKIKPFIIKQSFPCVSVTEYLWNVYFIFHLTLPPVVEDISKGMIEADQKIRLDLRAVRLDAQSAGVHFIRGDTAESFAAHIPGQLVHIVLLRLVMEAFQILCAGKQDQLFPCPGSGYVDQLPVIFQPPVGFLRHLIRYRCGK